MESNTKTDNAVENTPAPEENVAEDVDTVVAAPADNSPAEQQSDPDTIPAADPPSGLFSFMSDPLSSNFHIFRTSS